MVFGPLLFFSVLRSICTQEGYKMVNCEGTRVIGGKAYSSSRWSQWVETPLINNEDSGYLLHVGNNSAGQVVVTRKEGTTNKFFYQKEGANADFVNWNTWSNSAINFTGYQKSSEYCFEIHFIARLDYCVNMEWSPGRKTYLLKLKPPSLGCHKYKIVTQEKFKRLIPKNQHIIECDNSKVITLQIGEDYPRAVYAKAGVNISPVFRISMRPNFFALITTRGMQLGSWMDFISIRGPNCGSDCLISLQESDKCFYMRPSAYSKYCSAIKTYKKGFRLEKIEDRTGRSCSRFHFMNESDYNALIANCNCSNCRSFNCVPPCKCINKRYGGEDCSKCIDTFYLNSTSSECLHCNCSKIGTTDNRTDCNQQNGQCFCAAGYKGRACDECLPNFLKDKKGACIDISAGKGSRGSSIKPAIVVVCLMILGAAIILLRRSI